MTDSTGLLPVIAATTDIHPTNTESAVAQATETAQVEQQAGPSVTNTSDTTVPPVSTSEKAVVTDPITPTAEFTSRLPAILTEAAYTEVYGVDLSTNHPTPFSTTLILQKFLRANANNVDAAAKQLTETLVWRKSYQPLTLLKEGKFSATKFQGLGYITTLQGVPGSVRPDGNEICTFNIYGAVKDKKATFGDVQEFLKWRVALMEMSIVKLDLANTTIPIPDYGQGADPHQSIQIHDYLSVSFLRQDPNVKAASKVAIDTFSKYYPETLSRKFFVNVPIVMGWMFKAATMVLSKETTKKFTVLSYGSEMGTHLGKKGLPKEYGGDAEGLAAVGQELKME